MVPILESGIVLYIGEKENYGQTIIIEQIDGVEVYYSNINSNVKLYDYIEKGNLLEYAKFVGNYYGTPKNYVEKLLNNADKVAAKVIKNNQEKFSKIVELLMTKQVLSREELLAIKNELNKKNEVDKSTSLFGTFFGNRK